MECEPLTDSLRRAWGLARALPLGLYGHGLALFLMSIGLLFHSLGVWSVPAVMVLYSISAAFRSLLSSRLRLPVLLLQQLVYLSLWLSLLLLFRL